MINAYFYTSIGEFIIRFNDRDEAFNKIGSECVFRTPHGEGIIIPSNVQSNSIIKLVEV